MIDTKKLRFALGWRDAVASGTLKPRKNYQQYWAGYGLVSQRELDAICESANRYYELMGSNLRIGNSGGELRPAFAVVV
jgi:hypothetical protein